jgi:hypothetical protein
MGTDKQDGSWHEVQYKAKWKDRAGGGGWGCQCGTDDNYHTRVSCRGCGRRAPTKVIEQAAAAKDTKDGIAGLGFKTRGSVLKHPSAWAKGPSYKEEALQKALDKAKKTISELEKAGGKVGKEEEVVHLNHKGDAEIEKLKGEIEKIKGLGDCEKQMQERKARIEEIQKEKALSRPIHQQLRDAQGRLDRRQKVLDKKQAIDIPRLEEELSKAKENLELAMVEARQLASEVKVLQEEVKAITDLPKDEAEKDGVTQRLSAWAQLGPMFNFLMEKAADPQQTEIMTRMKDMLNGLSNEDLEKAIGKQEPKNGEPREDTKMDRTVWTEDAFDTTGMDMDDKTKDMVAKLKARAMSAEGSAKKQKIG